MRMNRPMAAPVDGVRPIQEADASEQATYDGWLLYHFAGDDAPGDTNGQGVNDVWFVVDPSGAAVEAAAGSGTDTDGEAGGY